MGQPESLKTTAGGPLSKPLSIDDLRVSRAVLVDLALKTLYSQGVTFNKDGFSYLVETYYRQEDRPLRACHPRDLVDQIVTVAPLRGSTSTLIG